MKTLALATTAIALAIGAAEAQDLPQAFSQWFTDGQTTLQQKLARQPITTPAKNVILFVADGMGVGTNYAIRLFAGQQEGKLGSEHVLPYEEFPYLALIKTYNVNAQTPDSAPTAGSMNTGVKQVFNTINLAPEGAVHDDCASEEGNRLTTFAEMMTEKGKSVGVVSTARITHATPAAVYAKTANRDWEGELPEGCNSAKDIATQLFDQMQAGVVDIALGGGRRYFVPEGTETDEGGKGRRKDGRNLVTEAKDAGAQYAWNTETFKGLNLDGTTPILGLFEDSHMAYEADRAPEEEPSLEDMTRAAIEYLANNDNGYYLEIEAGRVDHGNHDGNAYRTLTDGVEFAKAIAAADELTNDEDTLIIVTADHEHAIAFNGYCGRGSPVLGLCYKVKAGQIEHSDEPNLGADGKPYTVIGFLNGAGSVLVKQEDGTYSGSRPDLTEDEAQDIDYLQQALIPMSSETHSGEDVALWAKGPFAHLFDGTVEQNYIFHVMDYAVEGAAQ
ncbi:alkaline phosphatase [Acuticoccus sediminis]|uniref:Alkaline phosphatase n=1 Tax=Acuticoccus sediminis TaxID=2184697 RepID=A0A8B2NUW2_9HYPH|nr:alkaline phosphatase [Acuticoccus sediminis]RAI03968.1 alkaline phosphatase [Acuticoccus sediminis]